MAPKAKPYDQFGPYILFKKLEADSLGDLWRAAKIAGQNELGPLVALRRLMGGDRNAIAQSAAAAGAVVTQLHGTTFAKDQVIETVDGVPFIAFDYATGRSLRHIIDRARGGTGATPQPMPLDLAVLIAERIALSLATTADMRIGGDRLTHGALIPQFVWVTDEGEIRVAGQQLGSGIVASLRDPKVNAEAGRYIAPEYHSSGTPSKTSEVYSLGAMLFLLVTGVEPPDPLAVTAFSQHVRATKTTTGQPIPLEIRTILDKSLTIDPATRFASVADMKQALDIVAAKQPATTFNLAFYLSTLLKKEFEAETLERDKESKVNVAAYTAIHVPGPTFESAVQSAGPNRTPMIAAAAIAAVVILGGGGYFYMKSSNKQQQTAVTQSAAPPPAPKPAPILSAPIVASTAPNTSTAQTGSVDPNAAKKAFEDAVNQQLQAQMLKLQSDFNKQLQQKNAKNAPVVTEAPAPVPVAQVQPRPQPVPEEPAPSAAALDERRLQTTRPEPPQPQPQAQPVVAAPQPAAPAPVVSEVREGDVVEVADLDSAPRPLRVPSVAYPPPALRMRIETSVIVTALVSEDGNVLDVRVLRGDPRFGFNEAAMRAVRNMKFSSPVKDGKRVKTWYPQTINFKL